MTEGLPKELLEPISTMCRIISLNFMEVGTKISIKKHTLVLDRPYNYQGIIRYYNGYTRDHVGDLFGVVHRLITWYLLPLNQLMTDYKNESEGNDELQTTSIDIILKKNDVNAEEVNFVTIKNFYEILKKLIKYMINGLSQLQRTYVYGNVVFTLQYYKILLAAGLDGNYNDNMMPECILNNEYRNLLDYNKIVKLWNNKRLEIISDLFSKCFATNQQKIIECYLNTIDSILFPIDEEFRSLIIHSSVI